MIADVYGRSSKLISMLGRNIIFYAYQFQFQVSRQNWSNKPKSSKSSNSTDFNSQSSNPLVYSSFAKSKPFIKSCRNAIPLQLFSLWSTLGNTRLIQLVRRVLRADNLMRCVCLPFSWFHLVQRLKIMSLGRANRIVRSSVRLGASSRVMKASTFCTYLRIDSLLWHLLFLPFCSVSSKIIGDMPFEVKLAGIFVQNGTNLVNLCPTSPKSSNLSFICRSLFAGSSRSNSRSNACTFSFNLSFFITTFLMIALRQVKISLTLLCAVFMFFMLVLASSTSKPLKASIFLRKASQGGLYYTLILQSKGACPSQTFITKYPPTLSPVTFIV